MKKHENPTSPENLVADILNRKIYLKNISDKAINAIKELGASQDKISGRPVWLISYNDDHELAKKLHELNELGFLFIGEPAGWPPLRYLIKSEKKIS
jgi:CRISPR-associated protein Cas8b1/Cst1 subtype I-B